jgi:hypothetical protein
LGDAGPQIELRRTKAAALRLPPEHPARIGILLEPDFLPRAEGLAKFETYMRLTMAMRAQKK